MPNVELHKYSRPSMWRRMSLVNWRHPADPQVYARTEVDMTNALEYAQKESQRGDVTITPTHLVIRAVALCLKKYPDTNAIIRWNRVYTREQINIFCHVAIPGEKPDLSGVIVRDADTKNLAEIARELREKVNEARRGADKDFAKTRRMLDRIPGVLFPMFLRIVSFWQYTLNLTLPGMPRDPFGGALVTSVGSLGISEAFAPLSPITRAPMVVSVGKVEDRPVVRDGAVVVRPMCVLCATFDHRIMDGLMAGKLAKFAGRYLADPEKYEMSIETPRSHGERDEG